MEEQEADFRVRRKIAPCFLFMFHGLKITSLKYQYSKEAFSIGFAHHIIWKFDCAIDMEQIRKNLRTVLHLIF